jgi:hypothetical protein
VLVEHTCILNGRCTGTVDVVVDAVVDILVTLDTDFGLDGMLVVSGCDKGLTTCNCSLKLCSSSNGDDSSKSLKGCSYIKEEESSNGKKYLSGNDVVDSFSVMSSFE